MMWAAILAPARVWKGDDVNGKQQWTGIAPSPEVFSGLDFEEITVVAYLSWVAASKRKVTAQDVARLPDRDGKALGLPEAQEIVRHLTSVGIVSALGMNNERPLFIAVGGFMPRDPQSFRPSGATRPVQVPRPARPMPPRPPRKEPEVWGVPKDRRVEKDLEATRKTPSFVLPEAEKLRREQAEVEAGKFGDDLVGAATERLRIHRERIGLYERWLRSEPGHKALRAVLKRKQKAVGELEFQLERAAVKQAEATA